MNQTHWYSDGRSTSGPKFIRVFPLYGYLITVFTLICGFFIARCELFRVGQNSGHYGGETSNSSVLWRSIGITPHVFEGFPPIWLFNDVLHIYFCQFYRPLWIILRRVKWFDFSVGTIEAKHQTHRYSEWFVGISPHVYQGFPLIWLFNDCLHPNLWIFYCPLWIIPRRVKWFDF